MAGAVFLALLLLLFAFASDWGSAERDSSGCCFCKKGGDADGGVGDTAGGGGGGGDGGGGGEIFGSR